MLPSTRGPDCSRTTVQAILDDRGELLWGITCETLELGRLGRLLEMTRSTVVSLLAQVGKQKPRKKENFPVVTFWGWW